MDLQSRVFTIEVFVAKAQDHYLWIIKGDHNDNQVNKIIFGFGVCIIS